MVKERNTERKRTQRDYTLAFKLQVVAQIERGELSYKQAQRRYGIQGRSTVLVWLRKHGNLDWNNPRIHMSEQSPDQRIKELEQELLHTQKQLREAELKAKLFDTIITVAEAQMGIDIRKKSLPKQSKPSRRRSK
ncbi:MAG: transposase [Hymenobacteraceae bacterium]|nr:transposase [Hymenobacteraceae bacterium]MDX5395451.1 transposase [Hymenobacteraceae bacterium]MDX5442904.1 transposase [Hymenobacteraceae bacterium]MDX5511500.1 transposase [Hymenobacteraceae bacterium]